MWYAWSMCASPRGVAAPTSPRSGFAPPAIRDIYLAGDAEAGHRRFREHLSNGAGAAVDELAEIADRGPVALLCLERDASRCHRSVVATVTAERLTGERLIHDL